MTSPNEPETSARDGYMGVMAATVAAHRAAIDLARSEGTRLTTRPAFPGSGIVASDLQPLEGVRAAHQIEAGARFAAREYIRQAREDDASWLEIGRALGLAPSPDQAARTIAEAAYTYTAGSPDTDLARHDGRSFGWLCFSCHQVIDDRGPQTGPAQDEHDHSDSCRRLAEKLAEWEKQREAGA